MRDWDEGTKRKIASGREGLGRTRLPPLFVFALASLSPLFSPSPTLRRDGCIRRLIYRGLEALFKLSVSSCWPL